MQDKKNRYITAWVSVVLLCIIMVSGCGENAEDPLEEVRIEAGETTEGTAEEIREEPAEETEGDAADGKEETDREVSTVFVYVCGAVVSPGVYELPSEARIYEAIARAGGVTKEAEEQALNQAERVEDGARIYVPTKEEVAEGAYPGIQNPAGATEEADASENHPQGKVNINTAEKEELKTLPGIGDAKAESILRYREENGNFTSIEEVMQVEGIKEGVFDKIKDQITI